MAVNWVAVDQWCAENALDEWDDTAMADAALLADMCRAACDHGPLGAEELNQSILFPFGGPRWPWQNPEALAVVADEPVFDLQVLLANLPPGPA